MKWEINLRQLKDGYNLTLSKDFQYLEKDDGLEIIVEADNQAEALNNFVNDLTINQLSITRENALKHDNRGKTLEAYQNHKPWVQEK